MKKNSIDEETADALDLLRSWRDAASALRGAAHVEQGSSCPCCEDPDVVMQFMDDDILEKLDTVKDWASFHEEVFGNAAAYVLRMDVDRPTFIGGCPMNHDGVPDQPPADLLSRTFDEWCVWLGAFWVGERADLYWHDGTLGNHDILIMRTSDDVRAFDMMREHFYLYDPDPLTGREYGKSTDGKDPRNRLAEILSLTRKFGGSWQVEDFMQDWSGTRVRHHGRA